MQWNRSSAIGIARMSCSFCHGDGIRIVRDHREVPCNCVFRAAFRACYNRFRECVAAGAHAGTVSLEMCNGRDTRRTYSRKREEYLADFSLVGQRVLDDFEYRIFRFHFLLGADWKLCCRRMKLDRGSFFHGVYRIEQRMGRAVAEMQPFPLFPLDEYFGGMTHKPVEPLVKSRARSKFPRIRLPLSA
jgi:hypothetical protein